MVRPLRILNGDRDHPNTALTPGCQSWRMRYPLTLPTLFLIPALAWADGTADLRASLQRLHGHAPVKVEVACAVRQERTTLMEPMIHERTLRLQMLEDASGLHVDWDLAPADATPRDMSTAAPAPASATPMHDVLKDLDAVTLDHLLNQSDEVLHLLDAARFKSEGRETYRGNLVRVLTFTCKPRILPQHQGRVFQAESTLKIWIGDDGAPLAMESSMDYDGRHSRLYGRIHSTSLVKTAFTVLGERLAVASQTSEAFIYDYGDKQKNQQTLTLTLKD